MHEIEPETKLFFIHFQLKFHVLFESGIRIQIGVKNALRTSSKIYLSHLFLRSRFKVAKCDIQEPPNLYPNYFVYARSEPVRVHAVINMDQYGCATKFFKHHVTVLIFSFVDLSISDLTFFIHFQCNGKKATAKFRRSS
jgi:hypothetical protein